MWLYTVCTLGLQISSFTGQIPSWIALRHWFIVIGKSLLKACSSKPHVFVAAHCSLVAASNWQQYYEEQEETNYVRKAYLCS